MMCPYKSLATLVIRWNAPKGQKHTGVAPPAAAALCAVRQTAAGAAATRQPSLPENHHPAAGWLFQLVGS